MITAHAISINAQRGRAHYDRVSKWHSLLCGEHIHQGYWESVGSIREAQEHLIARLARIAQISLGAAVLDVACGSGRLEDGVPKAGMTWGSGAAALGHPDHKPQYLDTRA